MLPRQYVEKFSLAQFKVPPLSGPLIKRTFKRYFGKSPDEIFDKFNFQSRFAASIGQVHEAWKGDKKMAVKIQYPGVAESIKSDLALIKPVAMTMFNIPKKGSQKYFEEVESKLLEETDYELEIAQSEAVTQSCAHLENIKFPTYFKDYSGPRIITMDWIDAVHLSEWLENDPSKEERTQVGQALWDFYMYQIHELRKVHADPHPGNLMVDDECNLVVIDFGCMKEIPEDFYIPYFELAGPEVRSNTKLFSEKLAELEILYPNDSNDERAYFTDLFQDLLALFTLPFQSNAFDFSDEEFFSKVAVMGERLSTETRKTKYNPNRGSRHFIYMNRTFFGLFNLLNDLKVEIKTDTYVPEFFQKKMLNIKSLFSNFRGDFFGGITAGIVALPLALAFGVQSGLGATAGLYGAIIIGFFAALFGGTDTQISGPTAPMTATSMVIIGGIIAANEGNLEAALPAILMVFLLAGLIQILLGFVRVGAYIKYIPYPVVSGFMTGIGVIILVTQLLPMMGYYPKEDVALVDKFKPQAEEVILDKILKDEASEDIMVLEDFKETIRRAELVQNDEIMMEASTLAASDAKGVAGALKYLPRAIQNINWIEFLLALATIIIIYGFKRITKAIPSSLVALFVVTLVAVFGGFDYRGIGDIPRGFPKLQLGIFSDFSLGSITPYLLTAVGLALLGVIDSLLTSIVADNLTKTKHKPNKELIGQGIGNSGSRHLEEYRELVHSSSTCRNPNYSWYWGNGL